MLESQDHHLLDLSSDDPNKSSEFFASISELNKSGSSISTPNSFKSPETSSLSDDLIASSEKETSCCPQMCFNYTFNFLIFE